MAKKKEVAEKAEATKKKEVLGYIVAEDRKKYEVIGENGKYWVCKSNQFRKANVVFKKRKENE